MSISPDQTYLARTFDDGRYAWARSRRVRRRTVVAQAVLLAALVAVTVAAASTGEGWTTWYFVAWTVGMLGFIPLHSTLNLGIRGVFDRSDRSLEHFRDQILPAAARTTRGGAAYPERVAAFGVVLHEFMLGWCERLERGHAEGEPR